MTTKFDNSTLEWAAEWIEGSLKGESNERVREYGRNMAMTLRAAKTGSSVSVGEVVATGDRLFEAKLLGFGERDRIWLCEPCLRRAIGEHLVSFSCALPAAPAPAENDSCSHWREGDSNNCVWCRDDLGPTTEADVSGPAAPKEEALPEHLHSVGTFQLDVGDRFYSYRTGTICEALESVRVIIKETPQDFIMPTTPSPDAAREAPSGFASSERLSHQEDKAMTKNYDDFRAGMLRAAEMARGEFKRAPDAAKGHDCVYMSGYEDACDHLSVAIAQAAVIDSVRIAGAQPDWQYHIALLFPDGIDDQTLLKIYQVVEHELRATTPSLDAAPKEEIEVDDQIIRWILNQRKWYSEDIFRPWTIEEARRVHAEFPGAVDRIAAESARKLIDRIIADIREGKHNMYED